MIEFRDITPGDAGEVLRYVSASGRINCDLCFANIYGWQPLYGTKMANYKGWLLFSFHDGRHPAFMMPISDGHPQCSLEEVLEQLRLCAEPHPLLLMGLTQQEADSYGPEHWERNYDDYIYDRQALQTLSGKHLQAKRNHAHKFAELYPQAITCELQHIEACIELSKKWDLPDEQAMIERVLPVRHQLMIRGLELWVGDRLAAFTFGAPINEHAFDVMVEKADRDFEGSYAVINQQFVTSLPEQFTLIDREEDLGIEGLRQAKLSYHPVELAHKYNVWHR